METALFLAGHVVGSRVNWGCAGASNPVAEQLGMSETPGGRRVLHYLNDVYMLRFLSPRVLPRLAPSQGVMAAVLACILIACT